MNAESQFYLSELERRLKLLEKEVFSRKEPPPSPAKTVAEEIRDILKDDGVVRIPDKPTFFKEALEWAVGYLALGAEGHGGEKSGFHQTMVDILAILKGEK